MIRTVALLSVVAAACAQKPAANKTSHEAAPESTKSDAEQIAKPAEGEQQAPIIELMSLTISQEGRPIARLHPDGRAEGTEPDSTGKPATFVPGPTFSADGAITLTKGGFTARVERNGDIYVVSPPSQGSREQLFGSISGQELKFADSDKPWAVRVEGDIIRFNGPGFPNKIEGTVNEQSQHTALVMYAAFFIDMSITDR